MVLAAVGAALDRQAVLFEGVPIGAALPIDDGQGFVVHGVHRLERMQVAPLESVPPVPWTSAVTAFATWRGALLGNKSTALAALAKTQRFERQQHGDGERVVNFDHVDRIVPDAHHGKGIAARDLGRGRPVEIGA